MLSYPNVDSVITPAVRPPRYPSFLTGRTILANRPTATTIHPVHTHCAYMDDKRNGWTDIVASHMHRVVEGRIIPDDSDGHTHSVGQLPCSKVL